MVLAVHHGDLNGQSGKLLRCRQASKAGSYDYDSRFSPVVHVLTHYRDSQYGPFVENF